MNEYIISCCSTADLNKEHFDKRDISYICFLLSVIYLYNIYFQFLFVLECPYSAFDFFKLSLLDIGFLVDSFFF